MTTTGDTNRLAEIKTRFPPGTISDQSWLMYEVERLTAENERRAQTAKMRDRDIAALTAENTRLREALQEIDGQSATWATRIAREALEEAL